MSQSVVIVGGGLAAYAVSTALRKANPALPISIVTDEEHAPYDRPPLSKAVMLSPDAGVPYLLPPATYGERGIVLRTGQRVVGIDRQNKQITLAGGDTLPYGQLILATGGRPRPLVLPGDDAVLYLRSYDDALAIRTRLLLGATLVCIGAGVICLELAAVAARMGVEVHVVELGDAVMARMLPAPERDYFQALHRQNGVQFHFGDGVESLDMEDGHVRVQLKDRIIAADIVVAGIGMIPNSELAVEAGLDTGHGIRVDAHGRTSDPDIFALGDVAEFYHPVVGRHMLLESWYNAMEQAAAIAKTIAGEDTVHAPVPRFWTDQFGRNFQMAGDASTATQMVIEGTRDSDRFAVLYLDPDDRIVFALAADDPRRLRTALKSIQTGETYGGPAATQSLAALQPA